MNNIRRIAALPLLALLVIAPSGAQSGQIDAKRYQSNIAYLASDAMRGRMTGSPEMEQAAAFLAGQFEKLGLKPPPGQSGFLQRFDVTTDARLGAANTLRVEGTALQVKTDFIPLNFSGSGKLEGRVVFAGYGITAPEYNYDDYAGLDAKDKIAVILRHEPQEFDEKSVFAGKTYTSHEKLDSKAVNARFHGAKGVILVNDLPNHAGDPDDLARFLQHAGPMSPGVPFVQVKLAVAEKWFAAAGRDVKQIIAAIDKDLKPQSFEFPPAVSATLNVDVERVVKQVPNVAAYLKGATGEYVIIGAHYDHLGLGDFSSLAPSEAGKAVHHGADDNASGAAGLLELATVFAARQDKLQRGVLFLAFAGEELGLLGSSYYAGHPLLPLEQAVAMLNMDMIGRPKDGRVFVGGTGTGDTLKALVEEEKAKTKLQVDLSDPGGFGSSDHMSFTIRQLPVLFFFSGLHADYHKPSDTAEKIDAAAAANLLHLVAALTQRLIDAPRGPKFIRTADTRPQAQVNMAGGGAYFGSVPDFAETPDGFRIADVREGSPAALAGIKGGDIMVEFDGKPIKNLYDFTYALRARKPGDTVVVKVKRGGEVIATKAALTARK